MRIWFIRHAEAVDAGQFPGEDPARPLTAEGRRSAQAFFSFLASCRRGPDAVWSSEAVRAWETAGIFSLCFRMQPAGRSPLLNPGATPKSFRKFLRELPGSTSHIAVVGHEPDFSTIISSLTSAGSLDLKVRKGSVIEVDYDPGSGGRLLMSIPPDIVP